MGCVVVYCRQVEIDHKQKDHGGNFFEKHFNHYIYALKILLSSNTRIKLEILIN